MTEFTTSSSPLSAHGLSRIPQQGKILGVCAGLAEHFNADPKMVRLAALGSALLLPPPILALYVMLALTLPRRPDDRDSNPSPEDATQRMIEENPDLAMSAMRERFRAMERRIIFLEAAITGKNAELDQRLREFDRKR